MSDNRAGVVGYTGVGLVSATGGSSGTFRDTGVANGGLFYSPIQRYKITADSGDGDESFDRSIAVSSDERPRVPVDNEPATAVASRRSQRMGSVIRSRVGSSRQLIPDFQAP